MNKCGNDVWNWSGHFETVNEKDFPGKVLMITETLVLVSLNAPNNICVISVQIFY
jgi:hypothetical protein